MFEFLFDIKPDAGNVCPTTRLAYLISERGNKVYYTDTSDSVFTTGLLRKGIGRIISFIHMISDGLRHIWHCWTINCKISSKSIMNMT